MILAWVLASVVSSLYVARVDVFGAFGHDPCRCFVGMGLLVGSLLDTLGREFLTDPSALGPLIGSCALGVLLLVWRFQEERSGINRFCP